MTPFSLQTTTPVPSNCAGIMLPGARSATDVIRISAIAAMVPRKGLLAEPRPGYGIRQAAASGNETKLGPGTLYGALRRGPARRAGLQ
jgi:hypothetical protein